MTRLPPILRRTVIVSSITAVCWTCFLAMYWLSSALHRFVEFESPGPGLSPIGFLVPPLLLVLALASWCVCMAALETPLRFDLLRGIIRFLYWGAVAVCIAFLPAFAISLFGIAVAMSPMMVVIAATLALPYVCLVLTSRLHREWRRVDRYLF